MFIVKKVGHERIFFLYPCVSLWTFGAEHKKMSMKLFFLFSKQYRKYTTALLAESDSLLTFGIMGRSYQLSELSIDENFDDGFTDISYLVLTSIATGLVVILVIWRLCKIK